MINRRKFIANSGALALGALAIGPRAAGKSITNDMAPSMPIGLQLYTVTKNMEADPEGTLKRIAEIGYKELESASTKLGGYYGSTAKEFAAKAKGLGLSWKAHHITGGPSKVAAGAKPPVGPPSKNLRDNYQEVVNAVAEAGVSYLVCSSTPIETLDEIKQSIEVFNKTGEACKKAGIGFAFHNHWKEFELVGGKVPYEMFLSEVSADLMKFELDLGWATKSGTDPLELFKKHPGRFPLWHVKDLNRVTQKPVEIGAGYVDLKRIFDASKSAGLEHLFVEQDNAPQPLENIANSFKSLTALIK